MTRKYLLPSRSGMKAEVCKTMFLSTLGLKNDNMVQELFKAKNKDFSNIVSPTQDERGKHEPNNKIKYSQLVTDHINSYQPSITHYYREKAPTRRYLNPELSVSMLYRHYCESHPNFSLRYFQIIFKKQTIGFSRPSVDECVECLVYADHKKDNNIKQNTVDGETNAQGDGNVEIDLEKETLEKQFEGNNESIGLIIDSVHDVSNCEPCQSFRKHQETYRAARIEYLKPVPEGVACLAETDNKGTLFC